MMKKVAVSAGRSGFEFELIRSALVTGLGQFATSAPSGLIPATVSTELPSPPQRHPPAKPKSKE